MWVFFNSRRVVTRYTSEGLDKKILLCHGVIPALDPESPSKTADIKLYFYNYRLNTDFLV